MEDRSRGSIYPDSIRKIRLVKIVEAEGSKPAQFVIRQNYRNGEVQNSNNLSTLPLSQSPHPSSPSMAPPHLPPRKPRKQDLSMTHSLNNIRSIFPEEYSNPRPLKLVVNRHTRNGKVQISNNLPSQSVHPRLPSRRASSSFPPGKPSRSYPPITNTDLESHALGLKASACDTCISGFNTVGQLCNHLSRRPKVNFKCNSCIGGFRTPEKLEYHLNRHMRMICRICHGVRPTLQSVKLHIKHHKKQGISTRREFLKKNNQTDKRKYKIKKKNNQTDKRNYKINRSPAKSTSSNVFKSGSGGFTYLKNENYHQLSSVYLQVKLENGNSMTCSLCQREFRRNDDLIHHKMSHSGYRPFRCSLCTEATYRPGTIVEHFVRTHCEDLKSIPELYFDHKENCVLSKLWTGSKDTTATLHSTKKNSVNVLIKLPQTRNKKPSAMNVGNGDDTEDSSNDDSEETLTADEGEREEKPHVCMMCDEIFPSASMLVEHMTRLHAYKPAAYRPSHLNLMPTNSSSYSETSSSSTDVNTSKGISCSECNATFQTPDLLMEHLKLHLNTKLSGCTNCAKSFKSPARLEKHKRSCRSARVVKCGQCFNTYDTHLRFLLHPCQPEAIKCPFCNAPFHTFGTLLKHIPMHTAMKLCSYNCVCCGESFTSLPVLRAHLVSHKNDSYTCGKCLNAYETYFMLILHPCKPGVKHPPPVPKTDKIKRGKNGSYCCCMCGIRFNNQNKLINHFGIHSKVQLISCTICGQGFSHTDHFHPHLMSHFKTKTTGPTRVYLLHR